jgi:hypothetical protein
LVEGPHINALKPLNIVLRKPVKFNPDKREFVLTESALSHFDKDLKKGNEKAGGANG